MKLARILAFSFISILIMVGCLLAFSFILLKEIEYYNFKDYVLPIVVFMSIIYGFIVFILARFFKSKRGLIITILIAFAAEYSFMIYEIAFEARGDFGATWSFSEVFWELLVQKGKGLYLLMTGLVLSVSSKSLLPRDLCAEEILVKP